MGVSLSEYRHSPYKHGAWKVKASNCGGFTIQVGKFNFTASLLATAIWRQVQLAIEYTQYPHL